MAFDFKIDLPIPPLELSKRTLPADLLKEIVCHNQGELAQYSYLAGGKHKEMKKEFNEQSRRDMTRLRQQKHELDRHLNTEFKKIVNVNFQLLKKYFHGRAKMEPRFCLKAYRDNMIIDLLREENQMYTKDCGISDNKGFYEVCETGKRYLCNNIPAEIKNRRYFNPRLDDHRALKYRRADIINWLWQKLDKEDIKWIDCWEQISIGENVVAPKAEQCYKSTLITPMTLIGNTLWSEEFKRRFKIEVGKEKRAIYGFLCIDHHYTEFFNDKVDIPLSYIFADLLSLYLIISLTYTENSRTYQDVEKSLNEDRVAKA